MIPITSMGDNMIKTYRAERKYDPNAIENRIRRASQKHIHLSYQKRPIQIPFINFLLKIPFVKKSLMIMFKQTKKLIEKYDSKLLLGKEEN